MKKNRGKYTKIIIKTPGILPIMPGKCVIKLMKGAKKLVFVENYTDGYPTSCDLSIVYESGKRDIVSREYTVLGGWGYYRTNNRREIEHNIPVNEDGYIYSIGPGVYTNVDPRRQKLGKIAEICA